MMTPVVWCFGRFGWLIRYLVMAYITLSRRGGLHGYMESFNFKLNIKKNI